MFTAGETVVLAEWIIDDNCVVLLYFAVTSVSYTWQQGKVKNIKLWFSGFSVVSEVFYGQLDILR